MFILINGTNYNMYSISCFRKSTAYAENSDGTGVIKYFIDYALTTGSALKEEFQTEEARDDKYDLLVERFVVSE